MTSFMVFTYYDWRNTLQHWLGFFFTSTWMEKTKELKGKLLLLFIATFIFLLSLNVTTHMTYKAFPKPLSASKMCSLQISEQTLPPLNNTKHILVSAYMDQRVKGLDIRIIGIFKMDSDQPLYSLFCCACQLSNATPTTILKHNEHFGFPFITTDVMCGIPKGFSATHVTLLTQPHSVTIPNQTWLPIRNQKTGREEEQKLQFNFTVCISNLFGDYNNVLQFAQTLEMYRLVEQTSVHEVIKNFGERFKVPMDVCRIIHVRVALRGSLKFEQLREDKRLWDFQKKLIPNVDKVLKRAGLLGSEGRS
ncbi:uncharacterized protein [Pseudochaenichthys georgianus]|uniref:uncharacterized protein isoform X3 n=1 Tax=Pseudochaenichthys georgianus TaxID=52239 RepID=UPI00146BBADA|nr:uncharacterized protein LOC117467404 isoform X3 [Pseudochaenichthys georgianus]